LSDKRREQLHFVLPLIAIIGVTVASVHFYPVGFALRCAVFGACAITAHYHIAGHPQYSLRALFARALGSAELDQNMYHPSKDLDGNTALAIQEIKKKSEELAKLVRSCLLIPAFYMIPLTSPAWLPLIVANELASTAAQTAFAAHLWQSKPMPA
jgi:hypothetical protein